jgi:tRNA nucleotidyltransferase (CCA-adding enzyme)
VNFKLKTAQIHKIPAAVHMAMGELQAAGFKAFIVGGAVRDLLLNREPKDFDISTSALPCDVKRLFRLAHDIGGTKYGTTQIVVGDLQMEVTTFRKDVEGGPNSRKDITVEFTDSEVEDVIRRDSTINGLLLDHKFCIHDYVGGLKDLDKKLIRAIGDPHERIKRGGTGDPLRMMRYVRQAAQLGLSIDYDTFHAIKQNVHLLDYVSADRIRMELTKLLMSNKAAYGLRVLQLSGILKQVLPAVDNLHGFKQCNHHHDKDAFEHTMKVVEAVPYDVNLRFAALLHDVGKPLTQTFDDDGTAHYYKHHLVGADMADLITEELNFSLADQEEIVMLVREHMSRAASLRPSARRLLRRINKEGADLQARVTKLFDLMAADVIGHKPPYFNDMKSLVDYERLVAAEILTEAALKVTDLAISGVSLIELGVQQGPAFGYILNALLEEVTEGTLENEFTELYRRAMYLSEPYIEEAV